MTALENVGGYLFEMFGLSGKTAVITGGGGVLAVHIAEGLLKAGANVSLWGRHEQSISENAARLDSSVAVHGHVDWLVADATSESSIDEAMRSTLKAYGGLDILVNAVGGNKGKAALVDTDITLFEEVLRLNLVAGFLVPTKVICKNWIATGTQGTVINLASMGSFVPLSGVWAYDAAKAGVLNLTMAAAKEFAGYGIRVNAVAPGFFLGKQNRALLIDEGTGELTARCRDVISRTPCGRFGTPEELAGVILFLASQKASGFVTGTCIPVDGGFLVDCV